MEKKYQFFISSTYKDLTEERQGVRDAILRLYHFPIGMEMFSANNEGQWEEIQRTIVTSDYYIVIIGHKYGSLTDSGISYTEKEYDYAASLGIPIMAFIRNRGVAITGDKRESDPAIVGKLDDFIRKVKERMCSEWETGEDLAGSVAIAITQSISRYPRPGWIRNEEQDVESILSDNLKLSKELHSVKEENAKLIAMNSDKKPRISLEFNDGDELRITNYQDYAVENEICELSLQDVPNHLTKYITQQILDEYNRKLPKGEERIKYVNEKTKYLKTQNTGLDFSVLIENSGKAKANDVNVDIFFPEELLIVDIKEINKAIVPQILDLPANPIKKAEKEHKKDLLAKSMGVSRTLMQVLCPQSNSLNSTFLQGFDTSLLNPNKEFRHSIDDNEIYIRCTNLLHTKSRSIDNEYKIVPLKRGVFKIRVSIICEEYDEADEYEVSIEVV